jgi:hypothetical protein
VSVRNGASATLILMLSSSMCGAQGGPPMLTDDPGTPGPGAWEINLALVHRQAGAARDSELPSLDINYGVGDRIQLNAEAGWNWSDSPSTGPRSGFGDYSFGSKIRFVDDLDGWQMSTYPRIGFENGDEGRTTNVFLPLEFQREFGKWGVDFEFGHEFHSGARDVWVAGVVAGRSVNESLDWAAELHGSGDGSSTGSDLVANVGARVMHGKTGVLMLSIGRELEVPEGERRGWLAYCGWQFLR